MTKPRAKHRDIVAFVTYAATFTSETCLLWPFGRNSAGYGHFVHNGRHTLAHRLVCMEVHGAAPGDKSEAAHLCGNGHLGCVNPRHLAWKDRAGNAADMVSDGRSQRGEKHYQSVLKDHDVHFIRASHPAMSVKQIASILSVSRGVVHSVIKRKSWAWLSDEAAA